jgi:hypothetical protein
LQSARSEDLRVYNYTSPLWSGTCVVEREWEESQGCGESAARCSPSPACPSTIPSSYTNSTMATMDVVTPPVASTNTPPSSSTSLLPLLPSPLTAPKQRADLLSLKLRLSALLPPEQGHEYWIALVDFMNGKINRKELGTVLKRTLGTQGEARKSALLSPAQQVWLAHDKRGWTSSITQRASTGHIVQHYSVNRPPIIRPTFRLAQTEP